MILIFKVFTFWGKQIVIMLVILNMTCVDLGHSF